MRYTSKHINDSKLWIQLEGSVGHTKGINFNRMIVIDHIIGFYYNEYLSITFDVTEIKLKVYWAKGNQLQYELIMI